MHTGLETDDVTHIIHVYTYTLAIKYVLPSGDKDKTVVWFKDVSKFPLKV